jgi:arsenite methyltransferase
MDKQIKRFNGMATSPKSKPSEILEKLNVRPGQTVVEIGVGGGYYIERFAEIVGESGRVYGVDINMTFLGNLKSLNKKYKNQVVFPIVGDKEFFRMIPKETSLIFTRNTYHHLTSRTEFFRALKEKLSADGKLVIIDYNGKSLINIFGHGTKKNIIIDEMTKAGYKLFEDVDILKRQNFLIFGI